jgi:probable O-glycosylation ligase (exosortase A-associated)
MRDAVIFAIVFGILPFAFKRPVIGVFLYTWVSLMNPHRLTYGPAYDFPFALVIVLVILFSLLASKEPKKLPSSPVLVVLMLFMGWMTLTCLSAFEPERAWNEWTRVFKTLFMVFVTLAAIRTEKDIKLMAWVIGLSLGFYGAKGGIFTLASGGSSRVMGPSGTYIADNNDLALALVMTVPLLWYLQSQVKRKLFRNGLIALAVLTLVSAAGSYSRGALLASCAMLAFLWLKSGNKVRTGAVLLLALPLVYLIMPEQWFGRMDTINDYKADNSAMGRLNSWQFAFNLAQDNLMGGGFLTFTPRMFRVYAPNPLNFHAPHSIYFQVLGEHGFVGLLLFLSFLVLAWRTGSRVMRFCRGKQELSWAYGMAAMCQVSLVGYAVGGAFLTLAYYDLLYDIVVLLVLLERYLGLREKRPFVDRQAKRESAALPTQPSMALLNDVRHEQR